MWLFSARKIRPSTSARRVTASRPLLLEALEDRCLLNAGALDPTFGNGAGYVTTSLSGSIDGGERVLVQPSGNIVVAGSDGTTGIGVVTYNSNGSLDANFGTGGIAGPMFQTVNTKVGYGVLHGAALEPMGTGDDDILLAGADEAQAGLALMRLTSTGSLDTTFGSKGQVNTLFFPQDSASYEYANDVAVTSSGQIVAVGFANNNVVTGPNTSINHGVWMLARYNADGSLDASFGNAGEATTEFTINSNTTLAFKPQAMALEPNGQIVVVGSGSYTGANNVGYGVGILVCYNADGTLDTSFGNDGVVLVPGTGPTGTWTVSGTSTSPVVNLVPGTATGTTGGGPREGGVAIQPDGNIVAVGYLVTGSSSTATYQAEAECYTPNGSLDTNFGNAGYATVGNPSTADIVSSLNTVTIESDGKLIVAGGLDGSTLVARLNGEGSLNGYGSLDTTFGNGGMVTTFPPLNGDSDSFNGVTLQPDGNILAAGLYFTGSAGDRDFLVARYLGNATEPSFAITGPSGVTAGTAGTFTLTTLNPDGSADTSYSGTVQITSSDPHAILPSNVTITGGTGTFSVTLETAGTQSVAAVDVTNSSINGDDTGIVVSPAAASQVVFTEQPASGTVGQTLGTVEATLEDVYGNVETGDNSDQVTLSVKSGPSTQLGGTLTETALAGNALFSNLLLDTSGSYTLSALANLAGVGPVVSSNFTVASPVSLSFGNITYNSRTKLYSETVTLTNTTSGTLTGPMSLVLTNLPSGVVVTDSTGTTNGNPYVRFLTSGKTLRKGASTSITLTFTAASLSEITFGTEVVVGL